MKLLLVILAMAVSVFAAAPQCSKCAHRSLAESADRVSSLSKVRAFHNPLQPDLILAAFTVSPSRVSASSGAKCPHLQMVQYFLSKHPGATKPIYGHTHVTLDADGNIQRSASFGAAQEDDSMMQQSDWGYFWGTCMCGPAERAQCGWFM